MSRQYEESTLDTLSKVYSPLLKFLSVMGLLALIFVTINLFSQTQDLDAGYEYQEYIVRDYNMAVGPEDSAVTFVHLYDLQCPVCAGYDPVMKSLKEEYGDKVRIVYKHTPIKDLHPNAPAAAQAVQAAALQDTTKAFAYSSYILGHQSDGLTSTNLKKWAGEQGLDVEQWNKDRNSYEVRQMIAWDMRDIKDSSFPQSVNGKGDKPKGQMNGTPSGVIFVNKQFEAYIGGSEPLESMKNILDEALAKAGTPNTSSSSPTNAGLDTSSLISQPVITSNGSEETSLGSQISR